MPDTVAAVGDAAVVILGVRGDQQLVELFQGVDFWHRDAVVTAEPAALTLHPALLMRTLDTWLAAERVEPGFSELFSLNVHVA